MNMRSEKIKMYDTVSDEIDGEDFISPYGGTITECQRVYIPVEEVLEKVKHSCEGCTHIKIVEHMYDGNFTVTKYIEREETDEEYEARLDKRKKVELIQKNKKKKWTQDLITKVGSKEEVLKLLEEIK